MSESRVSQASEAPAHGAGTGAPKHFADRLVGRVRELGHPLCVGLDPHLAPIPPLFAGDRAGALEAGDPRTAETVDAFMTAVLERVADRVAIVKPQIAFFEQLGWRGLEVLDRLCRRAQALGVMVLLDAKRGDIGSTAEGYASAYLARDAAMPVDALTINPYLGFDTVEPFVRVAGESGRGLFVLVKTSNPGSGDLQDREVEVGGEGEPVFAHVAKGLARFETALAGHETPWSSLGVVCGATWPEQARRVREALPRSLFLVPGYGAQGGSAADAIESFVPGPKGREGGLVNSSRGILFPAAAQGTRDTATWEAALDGALDQAIDELGNAIQR